MIERYGLGIVLASGEYTATTSTLVSLKHFLFPNAGNHYFTKKRSLIHHPLAGTALEADHFRAAGSFAPSTSTITISPAWTDAPTGADYLRIFDHGIHPQHAIDAVNDALGSLYFENQEPLSIAPDAGLQGATVNAAWVESDADAGPATTFSKPSATTANTFSGLRNARLLNAAANGYVRVRFEVTPGEQVKVSAITKNVVGQVDLVTWDATNGAEIGSYVSHSVLNWQYMDHEVITIPDGCYSLEVRIRNTSASGDCYIGGLWVVRLSDRRTYFNSSWSEKGRVPALAYANFRGYSTGNGISTALGVMLNEIPRSDYDMSFERGGPHTGYIQWHDTPTNPNGNYWLTHFPIYIQGRRASSDVETLAAETDTTAQDLDLVVAMSMVKLFERRNVRENFPDGDRILAEAYADRDKVTPRFDTEGPAKKRAPIRVSSLSN